MSYQALARKWRPRRFTDVVGQAHVVGALTTALEQNRVHHAFLFTGTRGVGKTTLARLLAKALNCEQAPCAEPCGSCPACIGVDEGRYIDLLEIDAASRTRIDDTREILDNVQYAPTLGRYKVYLIDEVHMLSGHSFNALLKTLEEPPSHVKFLLATTDPQKLPPTILSRCLQFNLRVLKPEEITGQLQKIANAEGLEADEVGLATLARAASGSMRDALSLLDQGIVFGNGQVTGAEVREMLGMIEQQQVDTILRALAAADGSTLIDTVAQMASRAIDYMAALDDLLLVLHDVSLYQILPEAASAKQADSDLVVYLASTMTKEDVQLYYQIGMLGKRDMLLAPDPVSGFEMTLLRMLTFHPADETGEGSNGERPAQKTPTAPVRKQQTQGQGVASVCTTSPLADSAPPTEPASLQRPASPPETDLADPDLWAAFVDGSGLKGVTREFAMNLSPQSYDPQKGVLIVSLKPNLAKLHSQSRQTSLENAFSQFNGSPVKLKLIDGSEDAPETPTQNRARHDSEDKAEVYQTLMEDPMVMDIMERFDATVVPDSVRPAKQHKES
ncbi:MAG: DNA polymerase III subunit gamma/tau [Arenicellales bacterium]|nr:DNA polymerase III subunit gamma/tau [Arenicellales bacterium]